MKIYSSTEIESLYREYKEIYPVLDYLAVRAKEKLYSLINSLGISLNQPLQYRIKSWESTKEKLERGEVNIKKLNELQDLLGLRVVTLFAHDVEIVEDAISKSFHVIKTMTQKTNLESINLDIYPSITLSV